MDIQHHFVNRYRELRFETTGSAFLALISMQMTLIGCTPATKDMYYYHPQHITSPSLSSSSAIQILFVAYGVYVISIYVIMQQSSGKYHAPISIITTSFILVHNIIFNIVLNKMFGEIVEQESSNGNAVSP